MLQQGLTLSTARSLGKHGPHWRAHSRTASTKLTRTNDRCQGGEKQLWLWEWRRSGSTTWQSAWIQLRLYRNPRVSSSAGSKNVLFILLRLSGWLEQEDPGHLARPTVCSSVEESSAVDGFFCSRVFFLPPSCYCRSSLTSRPCHGSMLAFLFQASRDSIAAQLGGTGPVPRLRLAERGGGSP